MKVFIAVPLDDKSDRMFCEKCAHEVQQFSLAGRFVDPSLLHMTLIYIGETDRTSNIETLMSTALRGQGSFTLMVDRIGEFRRKAGSIVWLGGTSSQLTHIYESILARLQASQFGIEERAFQAHITLARDVVFPKISSPGAPGESKRDLRIFDDLNAELYDHPLVMPVKRIVLYASELKDHKRRYRELFSVPLL